MIGRGYGLDPLLHPARKMQRRVVRRTVEISLADAVRGLSVKIDGASGTCPSCSGEGVVRSQHKVPCQSCGGSGIAAYREEGMIRASIDCSECAGSGRTNKTTCHECNGYGSIPGFALDAAIPSGCMDGETFLYKGVMSNHRDGAAIDLEVTVTVREDGNYKVRGKDILKTEKIQVWDAALGCSKTVMAPDGKAFRIEVGAGSRSGKRFRLKGKGLGQEGERGDFIIELQIEIPAAVTGPVREAYEQLRDRLA